MKTIDLEIHLNTLELVLRNESIWCGQQIEGITRIKISERCLPFSLWKAAQLSSQSGLKPLWLHSSVLEMTGERQVYWLLKEEKVSSLRPI